MSRSTPTKRRARPRFPAEFSSSTDVPLHCDAARRGREDGRHRDREVYSGRGLRRRARVHLRDDVPMPSRHDAPRVRACQGRHETGATIRVRLTTQHSFPVAMITANVNSETITLDPGRLTLMV